MFFIIIIINNNIQTEITKISQINSTFPPSPCRLFKMGYLMDSYQKTKASGIIKHQFQQSRMWKKKKKMYKKKVTDIVLDINIVMCVTNTGKHFFFK